MTSKNISLSGSEPAERREATLEDPCTLPRWKTWVVQWDVTHFAIALAFAAFSGMWKAVCVFYSRIDIPKFVFVSLWYIALVVLAAAFAVYVLRIIIWPKSIAFDFANPRMVNFFFVPVIVGTLLVIGAPINVTSFSSRAAAFYVLLAYQVGLSLYLSGEWLFGSALIDVVHPLVFMQVIGYFLLTNIAASLLLMEIAVALCAVGTLFWVLIFVTNFQHTSSALQRRSEKPQPTFFLFIAPPAQAAIALFMLSVALSDNPQRNVTGLLATPKVNVWPLAAKAALYIDLFIYALIFRVFPSFWTQKFAIVWWAYIFPLSAAASATVVYTGSTNAATFWDVLSGMLVAIATIAMIVVTVSTVWGLQAGKLPRNQVALASYREQCDQSERRMSNLNHSLQYKLDADPNLAVVVQ